MLFTQTDLTPVDFKAVFEQSACRQLLLDTSLTIVAATDAYLKVTMTTREAIIGRYLFEVFPDNPDWGHADGVPRVRQSLFKVMKSRMPYEMPIDRYDIPQPASEGGGFEERHWRVNIWPILDADRLVEWIVCQVEDVTSQVLAQRTPTAARGP
jgi:two-component system, sensor histidine kinase